MPELAEATRLSESILGLIVGFTVIALSVPPGIALRRGLHRLSDSFAGYFFQRRSDFQGLLRDTFTAAVTVLLATWAIPFTTGPPATGRFSLPIPILLLGAVVFITAMIAFKSHRTLETSFRRTFLWQQPDIYPGDDA